MATNFGNTAPIPALAPLPTLVINSNTVLTLTAYGRSFKVTGAYTVTLPTAISGLQGSSITIVNDTSGSSVTLACQGSDFIRNVGTNVATLVLGPGDSIVLLNSASTFSIVDSSVIKASLNSPSLTGTPSTPTAAANTNTTQIASTAFVLGQASGLTPLADAAVGLAGSSNSFSRGDHTHPPGLANALTGFATTDVNGNVVSTATGYWQIPAGTTAQRGTPGAAGFRYNITLARAEIYNGTSWGSLGGATGGGVDAVFYLNDQTINNDYTVAATQNAMSAGPISIATGKTVTISSGSIWTIV